MRKFVGIFAIALVFVLAAGYVAAQQSGAGSVPPPWAYGFPAPAGPAASNAPAAAPPAAAPPDNTMHQLPGSSGSFTLNQIRDQYGPADWYPGDHPAMPEIVAHGKKEQQVAACSLCHYPNGKGRPENAAVVGLPYSYFVQTMMDFKNDKRGKSADGRKANTVRMAGFAKAMTDEEIKATAQYFSSMKWTPWIRVVETDSVPKTRINGGMFLVEEGAKAGKEPIGQRIIETPEKADDTENLRNPHSGFIAYVPPGSIKKGEALVMNGAGKTTACTVCHGGNLQGLGPVPGIAGRSPSYMVRQLVDMQVGTRKGEWTDLTKPVVAKLSADDMIHIAAYLASREVGDSRRSSK